MASSNNNKNAMYWLLLPAGVIVILAAVFMVGKVLGSRMAKPSAPVSASGQGAKVILEDQPASDQQRADRITLGETAAAKDAEAREDSSDKKDGEDKGKEKAKAEISSEDAAAGSEDAAAQDGGQKTKAIITTEPDSAGAGAAHVETAPAPASNMIYRLQLGAFEDEAKAKKVADEARAETGLTVIIGKKTVGEKTLFRLQCGAFTDKEKAQSYARELELKGLSVYVSEEQK